MISALPLISSAMSAVSSSDVTSAAKSVVANAAQSASNAGSDFGQMLSQMVSNTTQSLKSAEGASIDGLQGNANVQSVVQSVMSAQENLQTALAVRDKAVSAFQEITRMSI